MGEIRKQFEAEFPVPYRCCWSIGLGRYRCDEAGVGLPDTLVHIRRFEGYQAGYIAGQKSKDAEIARLREQVKGMEKDAGRLDWLEQHPWYDELECFNFVDGWQTPDGKRHSAGLRAVIDATLATKKEPA